MIDYHVHPDYSPDAAGSIREFCARARELGLEEMCFTTHFEPDPLRAGFERVIVRGEACPAATDWARYYLEDIGTAQDEFPELVIRTGVEIGYEMGVEGRIADFLDQYRFDFVLGAIHCLEHVSISGSKEVGQMRALLVPKGAEYLASRYFDYLQAAVGCRLFDCIAHLDIFRKYVLPLWAGTPEAAVFNRVVGERLGPALECMAENSVGIEVNTSALRRGEAEPYPSWDIVRRAKLAGVEPFTLGSDAHRPEDLGKGLEDAAGRLAELGILPARFCARERVE
ncbi:MAG: histidinol-phosphatase HisJ family protein [candidate division WOR-3 bacterium]|nr:MAG: histidinol-phosphatase HisJ family protein [candidate division WOR-3 bacterium]